MWPYLIGRMPNAPLELFINRNKFVIISVSALLVKKMENYDPFNSALYKFQGAPLFYHNSVKRITI